jgi:hypothetical protein
VHWIVERFGRTHEDVFLNVCNELGYPVVTRKMDSDTAQAMWDEGNVNIATQRVILRYLRATFGGLCMIPATTAITNGEIGNESEQTKIGNYKNVSPKIDVIEIDGDRVHYWTKPLLPLLNFSLSNRLYQVTGKIKDERKVENLKSIDIVVGGDHGQERFRMLAKVIARDENKKIIDKFVMKLAHIDCKKDTYQVLRDTITPSLNRDLKELTGGRKVVCLYKRRSRDSEYAVQIKDGGYDDGDRPVFVCPVSNEEMGEEFEYVRKCDIRLFMTGDMAFYACALGKVNMSGIWCTWCKLSSEEWGDVGHEKGEMWTKEAMDEIRERIYGGTLADEPGNRRGCVEIGLFDDVEVSQYIFPVLHAEIGLGNYLLKSFFEWVDFKIEEVSEEERNSKNDFEVIMLEMEDAEKRLDEWNIRYGYELNTMRIEMGRYVEYRGRRDAVTNSFLVPLQQRKEIDEIVKTMKDRINVLKKEKSNLNEDVKLKRKIHNSMKVRLEEYRKKRGKKGEIRKKLELKLREYGIDRPSYHGGDLTGVKVKVLLQKIDIIFDEFHNIILDCEDRKADEVEVFTVVTMYQTLGYLLDGTFSIARTPYGEMSDDKRLLMDRTVNALMKMWRYLRLSTKGPKIHGVEDHLRDQMNEVGGIGDFLEDFVEQGHQTGVKDEIRTKGLNRMKAFIAHSNWEFRNNRVGVVLAKEEVKRKTGRKRKRNANTRMIESKISRETKRLKSIEDVESGRYSLIDDYRGKGGIRRTRE